MSPDAVSTEIVDAHLHLWDRGRFDYPWMEDLPSLPVTSLPAALDSAATGAIVVEAGAADGQALAEADWLTALADGTPLIRGIVAAVDLTDPRLPEVLERLERNDLVVGVRDNFEGRAAGDLDVRSSSTARTLLSGIGTVLDAGLRVDLCVRCAQLPELDLLLTALTADRGSAAGLVLDHLGKPLPADPAFSHRRWVDRLTELAAHPGLHTKFSGLPGQIPGEVSAEEAQRLATRFAEDVIAVFGPDRTMYGSDHPVSTSGHGLGARTWERAAQAALGAVLDEAGLRAVMGGTAVEFYSTRRRP